MSEERLVDIETKLAYQEDALDQMNKVICEQHKRIVQLEATCQLLVERLGEMAQALELGKAVDEKPPHY